MSSTYLSNIRTVESTYPTSHQSNSHSHCIYLVSSPYINYYSSITTNLHRKINKLYIHVHVSIYIYIYITNVDGIMTMWYSVRTCCAAINDSCSFTCLFFVVITRFIIIAIFLSCAPTKLLLHFLFFLIVSHPFPLSLYIYLHIYICIYTYGWLSVFNVYLLCCLYNLMQELVPQF